MKDSKNLIIKHFHNVKVIFHMENNELKETNIIYLLIFPNNCWYVGQTTNKNGLVERIKQHCHEPFKIRESKKNLRKNNIIKKYMKFDVFILKKSNIENIDEDEKFFIQKYREKLVNIESGGQAIKEISNETRKEISETLKKYFSKHPAGKKVAIYDLKGNLLKVFNNVGDTAKEFNLSSGRCVWCSIKNKFLLRKKYQVRYYNNVDKIESFNKPKKEKKNYYSFKGEKIYSIYYYNENGIFIKEIPINEIKNMAFLYNMSKKNKRISHLRKNNKGYVSLDKKEFIKTNKKEKNKIYCNGLPKKVVQYDLENHFIKKWDSIEKANRALNLGKNGIARVITGKQKSYRGFIWKLLPF